MTKYFLAVALVFASAVFTVKAASGSGNTQKNVNGQKMKKYAEFSKLPETSASQENAAGSTNEKEKLEEMKLKFLAGKKMDIMQQMHQTRIQLIKKDPRLAQLRKRILSLTLELSQELNAKREMLELINALAIVEDEIREIQKKQAENTGKITPATATEEAATQKK